MSDDCILNPAGHRFFINGKTYTDFVPYEFRDGEQLYIRKEYAVLGCNCGEVFRKLVEER